MQNLFDDFLCALKVLFALQNCGYSFHHVFRHLGNYGSHFFRHLGNFGSKNFTKMACSRPKFGLVYPLRFNGSEELNFFRGDT